jgi:hypothetical protein
MPATDACRVDRRRASLEARIETLHTDIIQLRREQNALLPIGHLPPEILSLVFLHAQRLAIGPELFSFGGASLVPLWKALTRTCYYWRATALACLRLWSIVRAEGKPGGGVGQPGWQAAAAERTADSSVPLSVAIRGRREEQSLDIGPLLNRAQRISWRLHAPRSASQLPTIEGYLGTASPLSRLEALELRGESHLITTPLSTLQDAQLRGLRHLRICDYDWVPREWAQLHESPWSLTSLDLTQTSTLAGSQRAHPAVFLNVLGRFPDLVHLKLVHTCPQLLLDAVPVPVPVQIHKLQTLHVEDDAEHVLSMLYLLDPSCWSSGSPPSIVLCMESIVEDTVRKLKPELWRWRGTMEVAVDAVDITQCDGNGRFCWNVAFRSWERGPWMQLRIDHQPAQARTGLQDFITTMNSAPSLIDGAAELTVALVEGPLRLEPARWHAILGAFDRVHTLRVRTVDVWLLTALVSPIPVLPRRGGAQGPMAQAAGEAVLGALAALHVHGSHLVRGLDLGSIMTRWARHRADGGAPIGSLRFVETSHSLKDEDERAMQACVARLECDHPRAGWHR